MRSDDLKTQGEMLADHMNTDADFRAEWQRTALAREVATELIRYRSDHGLSQRKLAAILAVSQPRVVELESGEKNPKVETLIDIVRATGLEFTIDIGPAAKASRRVVKRVRDTHPPVVHDDVAVVVAAG